MPLRLERDALEFEPLHRRGFEALDLLADTVHVSRRIGDDAGHGLFHDRLKFFEDRLARSLVVRLARVIEQLVDARILVKPELLIPASLRVIEWMDRRIDRWAREVAVHVHLRLAGDIRRVGREWNALDIDTDAG